MTSLANFALRIKKNAYMRLKISHSAFLKLTEIPCLTLFEFPEIKIEFIGHKGRLLRPESYCN